VRVALVQLLAKVQCAMCQTARARVVEVEQKHAGHDVKWYLCVPCARRVGLAAVGGRWKRE
jgi:hypothetical protein